MKTPIWFTILVLTAVVFFKVGVYVGIYQFELHDTPFKAFMAAKQLELIESKKYSFMKSIQEDKLTKEIVNYGKLLEHGMPWMLWPHNSSNPAEYLVEAPSREEFMKKAIQYRKSHPIEFPYNLSECTEENMPENHCMDMLEFKTYYDKGIEGN